MPASHYTSIHVPDERMDADQHAALQLLDYFCADNTHPFNGPFSGITRVSRYQKGKTNLDFTEARDSEWQWHQLNHMVQLFCRTYGRDRQTDTQTILYW